jgi:SAM-dependent methyltransferase
VQADVLDLSYSAEFDLVTCFGALGHILPSDQEKFLRMIYAALKPGGRFIFVSSHRPSLLSLRSIALRTFNGVMRVRNALLKPPFIMYYLTFLLPHLEESLKRAGFEVEVRAGQFDRPFRSYQLVIATRPVCASSE